MTFGVKLLLALLAVAPFLTIQAGAMPIEDFARLNDDDGATFVTLLVEGAAKNLKQQGKPDQAAKAINLFKDSSRQGGLNQFIMNLRAMNSMNTKNAINPNNRAPVLEVENAMSLTLKDNGMFVPASYLLTVSKDYHPAGPPRQRVPGQ